MKTYAFVFARGGSKGLPGKNIRPLNGKPLIVHAIDVANSIPEIQRVFVSTDSEDIAEVAKKHSAIIIERPTELATDESPEWHSWQHAADWVENQYGDFDTFICLPATSPLRNRSDVERCMKLLNEDTDCVIGITESRVNPWFNMVQIGRGGYLEKIRTAEKPVFRRQDAPKSFDITTAAYVTRKKFILSNSGIFDGRVKGIEIPQRRALDIDTLVDFEYAEYLLANKLSDL
jgi:N,N'-diacetyl-8-epilegionaminate cytidylyltransferase